jgi:hypothetical protein
MADCGTARHPAATAVMLSNSSRLVIDVIGLSSRVSHCAHVTTKTAARHGAAGC